MILDEIKDNDEKMNITFRYFLQLFKFFSFLKDQNGINRHIKKINSLLGLSKCKTDFNIGSNFSVWVVVSINL